MSVFAIVVASLIGVIFLVCCVLQVRLWVLRRRNRRKMSEKIKVEGKDNE